MRLRTLLLAIVPMLAACSGSGGGRAVASLPPVIVAPAPTPPPIPAPTSPTLSPATVTLEAKPQFDGPPPTGSIAAVGEGWQFEFRSTNNSDPLAVRESDDIALSYDAASGSYFLTLPVSGLVTVEQPGGSEGADGFTYLAAGLPAAPPGPTVVSPDGASYVGLTSAPASRYTYVSLIAWHSQTPAGIGFQSISHGVAGFAQPTPQGGVPTTGIASYLGEVFGTIAGNDGDLIAGTATFDFDFASASLTGKFDLELVCGMGCSNDPFTYSLTNTSFARGATTFAGDLDNGKGDRGSFAGLFAGPTASELLASFQTQFGGPTGAPATTVSGIVLAKRN